jgi:hypothetical protein
MHPMRMLMLLALAATLFPSAHVPLQAQEEATLEIGASEIETSPVLQEAPPKPEATNGPLQVIGVLSASHMYTTFGYIGVTADALTKKVYPSTQVEELMTEVSSMCDNIIEQLNTVSRDEMSEDDTAALAEMVSIYRLLKVEAESLKKYAKDRTAPNAEEFEQARKNAWPRIAKLLGIKTTP